MTVQIKFGTDGWRGAIAEDYTFDNVRRVTQGFADYLKATYAATELKRGVVVGGDRRFPAFQLVGMDAVFSRQLIEGLLLFQDLAQPVP